MTVAYLKVRDWRKHGCCFLENDIEKERRCLRGKAPEGGHRAESRLGRRAEHGAAPPLREDRASCDTSAGHRHLRLQKNRDARRTNQCAGGVVFGFGFADGRGLPHRAAFAGLHPAEQRVEFQPERALQELRNVDEVPVWHRADAVLRPVRGNRFSSDRGDAAGTRGFEPRKCKKVRAELQAMDRENVQG